MLDDRVGQRKAETHEQRGNRHFHQHRSGVEPELRERADGWHPGIQRIDRTAEAADGIVVDGVHIGPPQAGERRGHEEPLSRHQPFGRTAGAAEHGAADQRADADADKNQCKQQREDGPEAAEQDVEVAEPQNLHAERGQADHRERDAGQPDGAAAVGDIAIGGDVRRPVRLKPDTILVRLKPDMTYALVRRLSRMLTPGSLLLLPRSVRLQPDLAGGLPPHAESRVPPVAREVPRATACNDVEQHRHDLCAPQPCGGHEHEVGEMAPNAAPAVLMP